MTRHEEHDGAGAARQAEPTGAAIVEISVLATVVVLFVAEIAAICFAQVRRGDSAANAVIM